MDTGITAIRPRNVGYDIGPDEKYREGLWVAAILGRGNDTRSDGIPDFQQVFIPYSSGLFRQETLDKSEEPLDESVVDAQIEEGHNKESTVVPDYTSFYSERDRLKTFGPWKQSYHVTPLELARNGFIYRGPEDRVTCVFCRKIIYKWEKGDVIEDEHRRISPKCPFVCGERDHMNIPFISSAGRVLDEDLRIVMTSVFTQNAHRYYAALKDVELRKETFINWHNISLLNSDSLSEAGFFYTGEGDTVSCHHCGVYIGQWEDDDEPWTKHAHFNPRCQFLLHYSMGT